MMQVTCILTTCGPFAYFLKSFKKFDHLINLKTYEKVSVSWGRQHSLHLVFDIKELVHLHHGLHNSGIVTIIIIFITLMADELTNLITERSKYLEVGSFH